MEKGKDTEKDREKEKITEILRGYDKKDIAIGTLGGHSALDICAGAKKLGFRTIAVCQRGREKTYAQYYKTRNKKGCVDEALVLERFSDILREESTKILQKKSTIFIESRYAWVYFERNAMEGLKLPIFGNRWLLKAEERDERPNQYDALEKAGIRTPERFKPEDIDRLCIVKAPEAERSYERAFFFVKSYDDYVEKANELIKGGEIREEALKKAVIEEYIIGAQINFNFFYSVIKDEIELMGTDMRRQTNVDGLIRIPADEQLELLKHERPSYIESGHVACTVKESLLEKGFDAAERFVATLKREASPGIIGPFALQGAVKPDNEFVVFDVSLRIPGSPGIKATPYTEYLYGRPVSMGERIAMEIRDAIEEERLEEVVT